MKLSQADTITALATPAGTGAIAVVRVSGKKSFDMVGNVFRNKKGEEINFNELKSHSIHFGFLKENESIIDEVLCSIFKNPHSYTGEDSVEISCHGSPFIQQQILELLVKSGARLAEPGEFTLRAFLNGKLDLAQAEAVADLIASDSASSHRIALQQLRGGVSNKIKELRTQLIDFASLIELELDFAEEDVAFADRTRLTALINELLSIIKKLRESFATGNAMKNGIPVVIAGKPNVGKSTLLNALLNDEKAIVSPIAGTTRDVIEDEIVLDGIRFRFIDTAGIRHAQDEIEKIGVERTHHQLKLASIVIYLMDAECINEKELEKELNDIMQQIESNQLLIPIVNKIDTDKGKILLKQLASRDNIFFISAKTHEHLEELTRKLLNYVNIGKIDNGETIVSNSRHAAALHQAEEALQKVVEGIKNNLATDLLAFEIRFALQHLGEITGDIYTDDLLANIFGKFCIGK